MMILLRLVLCVCVCVWLVVVEEEEEEGGCREKNASLARDTILVCLYLCPAPFGGGGDF